MPPARRSGSNRRKVRPWKRIYGTDRGYTQRVDAVKARSESVGLIQSCTGFVLEDRNVWEDDDEGTL